MAGIFMAPPFAGLADVTLYMLVLARLTGLFVMLPVFAGHLVPRRVKAALLMALSLVLAPVIKGVALPLPTTTDAIGLALALCSDFLVGLALGFMVAIVLAAVEYGGQLIGLQAGLSTMSLMNPATGQQAQFVGIMQTMLATVLFLCFQVHYAFITLLVESYRSLPPGGFQVIKAAPHLLQGTAFLFVLSAKLAAPVMVALFASTLALGVLARAFPAMNVFTLSFPITIGVSLVMLGLTAYTTTALVSGAFNDAGSRARVMLRDLSRVEAR